jgi:hypothetical protein
MDPMGNTSTTNLMNNNNNDVIPVDNHMAMAQNWLPRKTWMVTLWLFNIAMENHHF